MGNPDRSFRPNPDVVATDLGDGETVLLHLRSKAYYSLNATGTRVWRGLEQGLTPGQISERLQSEFEVGREKAERCVRELLRDLADQKLVQVPDREGVEP